MPNNSLKSGSKLGTFTKKLSVHRLKTGAGHSEMTIKS